MPLNFIRISKKEIIYFTNSYRKVPYYHEYTARIICLKLNHFHQRNATNQSPFFDIDYSGSYRSLVIDCGMFVFFLTYGSLQILTCKYVCMFFEKLFARQAYVKNCTGWS